MYKPWQQGRMDGLCGVYSVLNSVNFIVHDFSEDDGEGLFKHLIISGGTAFPKAVYDGLSFKALWDLAHAAADFVSKRTTLEILRPFYKEQIADANTFLNRIAKHLEGRRACAIIGIASPWEHWSVVTRITPKSLAFRDSCGIKRVNRSRVQIVPDVVKSEVELVYHQTLIIAKGE